MQKNTGRKILIWSAIALSSGLSGLVGWYWSSTGSSAIAQTVKVQRKLAQLATVASAIENAPRGYLLTKDESFLQDQRTNEQTARAIHDDLARLVDGNPEQSALVGKMGIILDEKIATAKSAIDLYNDGKLQSALDLVSKRSTGELMANLESKIMAAQRQEDSVFRAASTAIQWQRLGILLGLVGLVAASASLTLMSISREREKRLTVEATARLLTTSNIALEKRVSERTKDIEIEKQRAETERERAEALLRDVTHRIGNTLALVNGFINLHIRHAKDPRSIEILAGARSRIHAIASAQRRINVTSDLDLVRIDTLIEGVMSDLISASETKIEIAVRVAPLLAAAQHATSLCVLTQEFVMNSLKHAFPDGRNGRIVVELAPTGNKGALLTVTDNGCGISTGRANAATDAETNPAAEVDSSGLGAKIAGLLAKQFNGEISHEPVTARAISPGTKVVATLPDLELSSPDATTDVERRESTAA